MTGKLLLALGINGLSMGIIYAMIAMGLILLIRSVGMLNFAQGDMLALGAYMLLLFGVDLSLPLPLAIMASMFIFAVFALLFMFAVYWPLRNNPYPITITMCCLGTSIALKEALRIIFGGDPVNVPYFLMNGEGKGGMVSIFGISIQSQYLIIIGVGILVIAAIFILYEKLYVGKMMEAASQDKYAAEVIGIPTIATIGATYILSITVAGLGGFMIAPLYTVNANLGSLQFGAFAGAVIGGWGNTKGAIIGCLMVGLIEAYAHLYFTVYKDAAVFVVMVLFLLLRPQGLFPSKIGDKA